jgi:hypothetical protein
MASTLPVERTETAVCRRFVGSCQAPNSRPISFHIYSMLFSSGNQEIFSALARSITVSTSGISRPITAHNSFLTGARAISSVNINRKAAMGIGLAVPESLLARA